MSRAFIYSDISDETGERIYDLDSVRQSIFNLLQTRKGTRLFNSSYGCDIDDILMEPMSDGAALMMYSEILQAIDIWEPRVSLDTGRTKVTPNYETHIYEVDLVFTINGLDNEKFELSFGVKDDR